jgi:hypothetical protein
MVSPLMMTTEFNMGLPPYPSTSVPPTNAFLCANADVAMHNKTKE